jgi:hypothetical protein
MHSVMEHDLIDEARGRSASSFWPAAGAIAGPNLASPTKPLAHALGVLASAAPFAVAVVAHVIAAVILLALLWPDPLLASREARRRWPGRRRVGRVPSGVCPPGRGLP